MQRLVLGNWKLHGSMALLQHFIPALRTRIGERPAGDARVGLCVPFPYLAAIRAEVEGSAIAFGAQDVSEHANGTHTGEVSAQMLAEFAAHYAIVGHSERRQDHAESSELVGRKARAALQSGVVPVVCIGETLQERECGRAESVVLAQLDAAMAELEIDDPAQLVVAYEPVWAIGTGKVATPAQAQAMHAAIRQRLAELIGEMAEDVPLLYGGSVKPDNAKTLFSEKDINGALVGGASLKADEFAAICAAANDS